MIFFKTKHFDREYYSMKDAEKIVTYTCTVQDGGLVPQFVVTAEDAPEEPVIGTSATGAWTHIIKSNFSNFFSNFF